MNRSGFGRWSFPFGNVQRDTAHLCFRIEIAGPFPGSDGNMRFRLLRRNCHHLRTAPAKGPQIAIANVVCRQHGHLGRVNLLVGIGNVEIKHLAGRTQAVCMICASKDGAAIGTLALKHQTGVMQAVAEGVCLGVAPFNHFTIEPD